MRLWLRVGPFGISGSTRSRRRKPTSAAPVPSELGVVVVILLIPLLAAFIMVMSAFGLLK